MLWLSLGENCLPDDILQRHGLKSFSTLFSPCRSNIDYILQLERDGYDQLLDQTKLLVGDAGGQRVVRSTSVLTCDPIFQPAHSAGFEFTHHDPLGSDKDRASIRRKIDRLLSIRGRKDVAFLYHHRRGPGTHIGRIIEKLATFVELYRGERANCHVVLFSQALVSDESARRLEYVGMRHGVLEYTLHTCNLWAGDDNDIFWARVDDDLLMSMLQDAQATIATAAPLALARPRQYGASRECRPRSPVAMEATSAMPAAE